VAVWFFDFCELSCNQLEFIVSHAYLLSQEMFLEKITSEFEQFKDRLTQEMLNLKTRAFFRHNKALETVINACTLINGRKHENACRDFIEITPIRTIEYVLKINNEQQLSILLKLEFANPQMEEIPQTFIVLNAEVPIGMRNKKFFYMKLLFPKAIAYSDRVKKHSPWITAGQIPFRILILFRSGSFLR
jgi:hypothetical protein